MIKKAFLNTLEDFPKEIKSKEIQVKDSQAKAKDKNIVPIADTQVAFSKGKLESPPFLLTFKIFGKNLHNFLVDFGASTSMMSLSICQTLGLTPTNYLKRLTQLDKIEVNIVGELTNIHMQLASDPRIQYYIGIQVVEIPDTYGMVLSRVWSKTLNGYMDIDFSHMWLRWKGVPNQIRIEREP